MLKVNSKLNPKKRKVKQHNAYIESLRGKGNENQSMMDVAEEIKEQHN